MSKTHITVQGDMWDGIAHNLMGGAAYTDRLMMANAKYLGIYIFPAGISLTVPDTVLPVSDKLPPWKRATS